MRKVRIILLLLISLVVFSACSQKPPTGDEDTKTKDSKVVEYDDNYKTEIPVKDGKINNISLDTDAYIDYNDMDEGLTIITKEFLDPKDYFYQAGQVLDEDDATELLARNSDDHPNGLNPEKTKKEKDSPIYVNTMVEQDYYTVDEKNNKQIDTIAIGFGIDTSYVYNKGKDPVNITDDEIENYITQLISNEMVSYLREVKDQDVNIICGFFKESEDGIVPGYYYSYGYIPKDSNKLEKVELTHTNYELFPSESSKHSNISDIVSELQSDINSYFVDYSSLIAIGKFNNDELEQMDVNITINLYSTAEIESFVEFVIDEINNTGQKIPEVDVNITSSSNENIAIITYENGNLKTKYVY